MSEPKLLERDPWASREEADTCSASDLLSVLASALESRSHHGFRNPTFRGRGVPNPPLCGGVDGAPRSQGRPGRLSSWLFPIALRLLFLFPEATPGLAADEVTVFRLRVK